MMLPRLPRRSRQPVPATRKFPRFQLEALEARDVPATSISFTGGTYSQNFDQLQSTGSTALAAVSLNYLDEAPINLPAA
jgi:hypothetical protein